jgi:DNA mismatch repair protein MutS2
MEVPVSDVEPADGSGSGAAPEGRRAQAGRNAPSGLPEVIARPEIDLRGLRTDEIDRVVLPAVDAAHVSDLPTLRIIHGKGTFALRERVADLLGRDRRIARLRPGGFEEGGSGVTVVEFRRGAD